MILDKSIPLSTDDTTKEKDESANKRSPFVILFPIFNELTNIKGVLVQLFFAIRDIAFLPLSVLPIFNKKLSEEKKKYNFVTFLCFFGSLLFIHICGFTIDWFVQILSSQKFYPMKGCYTLSYIMVKHLAKLHDFIHKALRGSIREKKSVLLPAFAYTFYIIFSYFVHLFQIGVQIAGYYQPKEGAFMFALAHVQVINYKKFLPKFSDGNQFIQESFYRLTMLFAIIFHFEHNTMHQVKAVLIHEYAFAMLRILLATLSTDFEKFKKSIKNGENNAVLELNGVYKGATSKSTYIVCYHESIAIIMTMLLRFGTAQYKKYVLLSLFVLAVSSVVVPKLWMHSVKADSSKDEKKKKD